MKSALPEMKGFEHLVPGWDSKVAHPYSQPVEAGIRAEIDRLRGARYLVVVLHREYDYDGLYEEIFLDAGFVDPMEAVKHAQQVREDHCHSTLAGHPNWRPLVIPTYRWPSREVVGATLLRLLPQKFGTGRVSTPERSIQLFCRSTLTVPYRRDCSSYWTKPRNCMRISDK